MGRIDEADVKENGRKAEEEFAKCSNIYLPHVLHHQDGQGKEVFAGLSMLTLLRDCQLDGIPKRGLARLASQHCNALHHF